MGLSANTKISMLTTSRQASVPQQPQKTDNNLIKKEEAPVTNPFDYSQEQINAAMASYTAAGPQAEAAGTMAYTGAGAESAGTMASAGSVSSVSCVA